MMGEVCFSALNAVYTIAPFWFRCMANACTMCTQCKERYCSQKLNNDERDGTHAPNADLNVFDTFSVNALAFHSLSALLFLLPNAKERESHTSNRHTVFVYCRAKEFFSLQVASAWCVVYFPKIAHTERKTWIIHVKNKEKAKQQQQQQHRGDYILSNTC